MIEKNRGGQPPFLLVDRVQPEIPDQSRIFRSKVQKAIGIAVLAMTLVNVNTLLTFADESSDAPLHEDINQNCEPSDAMTADEILHKARGHYVKGLMDNLVINASWTRVQKRTDSIASFKPRIVRIDIPWSIAEPSRNNYNFRTWDRYIAGLKKCGITPMITFYRVPEWVNGRPDNDNVASRSWIETPSGDMRPTLNEFRNFTATVAERYSGNHTETYRGQQYTLPQVDLYEIWNEPNSGFFLNPQFKNGKYNSPSAYCKLTTIGAAAIRRVNSGARIVSPSLFSGSTVQKPNGGGTVGSREFLEGLQGCDAKPDAYSIHMYPPQQLNEQAKLLGMDCSTPQRIAADLRCNDVSYWVRPDQTLSFPSLLTLRSQVLPALDKWAGPLPLIISETGFTVNSAEGVRDNVTNLPLQVQAEFMREVSEGFDAEPRVVAEVYFDLQGNEQWDSGLLSPDGQRRPIGFVYRELSNEHR